MPPMASALATEGTEGTEGGATSSRRMSAALSEPPRGHSDGLIAGRPSRPRSGRHGSRRVRWRRRVPVLLAAILLVGSLGVLAFNLPGHGTASEALAGHPTPTSQGLATEAAVRKQAVNWVVQQVSQAAVVSCDQQVCADLVSAGFPASDLLVLGPTSTDPLGSALVIATATIRAQFGARLDSVYAPAVIASFGSGNARIDIRLVYSATTYPANAQAALTARKVGDAQLLANSQLKVSATARAQLLSGDIDPRLSMLLAEMAGIHPVHIVAFVNQSPGGGSASLLRSVDLATAGGPAHMTSAAYLSWMQSLAYSQTAQFLPEWVQKITPRTGPAVLRIGYQAPSSL
jgi:hypothetical protein